MNKYGLYLLIIMSSNYETMYVERFFGYAKFHIRRNLSS